MTLADLQAAGHTSASVQSLLYDGIDGYALAAAGRERRANFGENFTYGDVTMGSMLQMLELTGAAAGETFYDLGAGTGKGVLYAALLSDFGRCVGIELVEELHGASAEALERYRARLLPALPERKRAQAIEMLLADLLETDFSDADVVFSHCTCFPEELMAKIAGRCERLKSGSRVVTVSKALPEAPHMTLSAVAPCQMAWGSASLYVYRRA